MPRYDALPPTLAPRGLCRAAAAQYICISATTFDKMVKDGRMPSARCIDARRVWDRYALDRAFDELPADGVDQAPNPWDAAG